jgi:peptidoglycan/LPS O-acetylase OafA/YrhL
MPQLDSLRTFAVLLVVIYHWFPIGEGINRLPNGAIGVMIFFVISGFLITRILLENRKQIDEGNTTISHTYRNFFIRRVLRIFPLYYLVITLVLILIPEASDIDEHPLYYYLYGYNLLLHQTGNWWDLLSPFWTLGVEEQLYLVWPWLVLLTPRSTFRWVLAAMIVFAVAFRAYGYRQGDLDGVLTPASFDAFGLGAIWAYIVVVAPRSLPNYLQKLSVSAILAIIGFACLLLLPADHILAVLLQRLLISIVSLYLVTRASIGFTGVAGKILENRTLQYVGRISYGIYVFHMLVPGYIVPLLLNIPLLPRTLIRLGIAPTLNYWEHRIFSFIVLLAVSSVSWYAFEKPINELKRYFAYKKPLPNPVSR